ncbi:hypothetical protein [uncultured Novosphingobium sp.]|uniref:hypothetical protein n=1 Tax=uncultured Novosphingobium sp. TaxID=292277 RepID=UPI00259468F7|nr:hypothetical protein [uncultured Novosphingobium sp.]
MGTPNPGAPASSVVNGVFDPVDWLDRFKAVGGFWFVTPDKRLTIGWLLEGFTMEQTEQACTIWRELGPDAVRLAAIHAHLIAGRP